MSAETSLHAALKAFYATSGGVQETPVDGYWIDVIQDGLLIEIQTRNFSILRPKLKDLLERHPVRLVHPIPFEKWIVQLPVDGGKPLSRRRSPRRGRVEDLFWELIRLPDLIAHPNFSLEVLLTREEEHRRDDGRGSWRRGGKSIVDRLLLEIIDRRLFQTPADLLALLPITLAQPFTNRQLAQELHMPLHLAGKMSYCLRSSSVIQVVGRQNRQHLFSTGAVYDER